LNIPEIDIVYTWVDGSEPGFAKKLEYWKGRESAVSKQTPHLEAIAAHRFRDLDNLRHSLRSVVKYFPSFRRIHIVTNGQVPVWLKQSDRVRIVCHEQIFENPEHLPTFNAFAIEWCLPNIPDLVRHFLYLNDDTFFLRPTKPEYFFGKNGLPKLFFSNWPIERRPQNLSFWNRFADRQADLLDKRFGTRERAPAAHGPYFLDKEHIRSVQHLWRDEVERTLASKFRKPDNIQLQLMYLNSLLDLERTKPEIERHEPATFGADLRLLLIGHPESPWRNHLHEARADPPRFLCLNDDAPEECIEQVEAEHRTFLAQMFPEASPFEKKAFSLWRMLRRKDRT